MDRTTGDFNITYFGFANRVDRFAVNSNGDISEITRETEINDKARYSTLDDPDLVERRLRNLHHLATKSD